MSKLISSSLSTAKKNANQWRHERLNRKRSGYIYFIGCFYYHPQQTKTSHSPMLPLQKRPEGCQQTVKQGEARFLGYRQIYIQRERKQEGRGVKRDPTERGRDHTQGLSSSVEDKREKRNWSVEGIGMSDIGTCIVIGSILTPTPLLLFLKGGGGIQEDLSQPMS